MDDISCVPAALSISGNKLSWCHHWHRDPDAPWEKRSVCKQQTECERHKRIRESYTHTYSYSVCVCLLYMQLRVPRGDVMGQTHPHVCGASGLGRADGLYFSEEFINISSLTWKTRLQFPCRDGKRLWAHRCSCQQPFLFGRECDATSSPTSAIWKWVQMLYSPMWPSINYTCSWGHWSPGIIRIMTQFSQTQCDARGGLQEVKAMMLSCSLHTSSSPWGKSIRDNIFCWEIHHNCNQGSTFNIRVQ